ncbi:hypothetical protein SAMN05216228_104822 [Rhizobium tibeticum]|uniref:Uncharacterized protein n=1 Tax=Rhizobium tibeticum TaxID=501024 RepID=A0A1H8VXJ0_9HYPH|nr:hypothetical protein RTCCBAU85039_3429 [Rhizobium tibeticum]SEP19658.1 hypothetical protein SAMN05216228_104822 [Rhizobium tibeticum]
MKDWACYLSASQSNKFWGGRPSSPCVRLPLVLQPFLSAILWAAVICFSTWPAYRRSERVVGGNKSRAAAIFLHVRRMAAHVRAVGERFAGLQGPGASFTTWSERHSPVDALLEQNDEWAVQRARYMTLLETMASMSDDPQICMPAVAR